MDSALDAADRPISYTSTSSSASSRDSHCSLGSRSTLVSAPNCNSDRDSGAIRLELIPAKQLEEGSDGYSNMGQGRQCHPHTPMSEFKEASTNGTGGHGPRSYVDRVVQEILDTERTYVQDLRSIVEDYLESINDQSVSALSPEDKGSLFGNIQDIYHFNRNLLEDLEQCDADPVAIGECFVSKSEDFHIYTQYCTNYPRSVAVLTECMRNKALAKFFRERQESLCHSLPLGSYLLKPVQRILKYHLLLHEIANHLEKDTETLEVVQEAIDTMQRVAWHINDMKRKHEHAVRLQEIQSLLTNWKGPDLIGYGELVLEGTFRLQRAKNERTLFLFDKLLLITKKREETYTYKAHILCCNLMLVEVIPKEPLSFSVFHYKNPKLQHTVQAKSQQDKRMWILHLKRLILENHPAKIPAKVRGHAHLESLSRDSSRHPPLRRSSRVIEEPPESPIPTVVVTQSDQSVNSIWADHRARRAMFPTRQRTMQPDEDEDIYQMFVPSEASNPESETQSQSPPRTARPVSWHEGQVPTVQVDPPPSSGGRVLRRASSAGEKATEAKQSPESDQSSNLEVIHTESSSNDLSASSSAEQLTLDDVENVYDNISYEDLKNMGLVRRDLEEKQVKEEVSGSPSPTIEPDTSSESNRSSTQEAKQCELNIEEENIYDTICFRELPTKDANVEAGQERDGLLASQDLSESLRAFVSEESLRFEDEANNNVNACTSELDLSSSGASETFAKQKGDRMSEKVDEIWDDLENYIKVNEKKADRLPAAFPVNKSSPKKKSSSKMKSPPQTASPSRKSSTPMFKIPVINIPDIEVTNEDELAIAKDAAFKDLLFPGELASLDSPLASSSLLLGDSADLSLELMDKTKSRVFLMARQYSQKIKKANQLLRMRSVDPSDTSVSRARAEKKQKDLAAILEEKKQGGAAIGARIAEYSQLYDQVMFPPGSSSSSSSGPSTPATPHHPYHPHHPGLPSSPSLPETSTDPDWLHSTYSNGELASFITPSPSPSPASKSSQSTPMSQRWSACMSAPSKEEEHIYSTIKRHTSFNAPSLPAKNQPVSHVEPVTKVPSNRSSGRYPSLGRTGRHHSLPESTDITLHDGQQVVVLNRASALSILTATQNYFTNFKDNGEDDDDYVEIRSEDESEQDGSSSSSMSFGTLPENFPKSRGQSHSLPCTPVHACDPLRSIERHHLEKYLWSEPQHQNQPKIVQSLREKFHCLSSSSFA
uniref:Pleckstrin homology and RhoGEF domain containing G1 n=1 Tax=Neogobius melanostomus TaxID=47308 RepID=A0A8C6TRX3_9GOBI